VIILFSKNNINKYDLVRIYGNKFNYKPLIIECFRDHISQMISLLFEFEKSKFNAQYPLCLSISKKLIEEYYSEYDVNQKFQFGVVFLSL